MNQELKLEEKTAGVKLIFFHKEHPDFKYAVDWKPALDRGNKSQINRKSPDIKSSLKLASILQDAGKIDSVKICEDIVYENIFEVAGQRIKDKLLDQMCPNYVNKQIINQITSTVKMIEPKPDRVEFVFEDDPELEPVSLKRFLNQSRFQAVVLATN